MDLSCPTAAPVTRAYAKCSIPSGAPGSSRGLWRLDVRKTCFYCFSRSDAIRFWRLTYPQLH
jgi:hypothetical protein